MSWNLQKINNGGNTDGPAAVQTPYASVFNSQQHLGYRDGTGNIWDSWYDPQGGNWKLQKINNGGNTKGPSAVEGPFIGVYRGQQHFAYIDNAGSLWDSWYDGPGNRWNLQKINNGGNTSGPAALFGSWANWVSIWVDGTGAQQHFTYLGADRAIYDAFWDAGSNSWRLQKINAGGNTSGPPAATSPEACLYNGQQHIGYGDNAGNIWDSWYDPNSNNWKLQKINNGGDTVGPASVADSRPFLWITGNQQHFSYLGDDHAIYDPFWDGGGNSWRFQKINSGGATSGPASIGAPFASVYNGQQHIGYMDNSANIWDSWYDPLNNSWNLQKINNGGMTNGPGASHGACIWVWNAQQHFTYVDAGGTIWDSWWDGASPSELKVTPTSIEWSHNVNLEGLDVGSIQGPVGITVTSDGNYNFTGQLNNSAWLPYDFSVLIVLKSKSGTAFVFGVSGSIGAGVPFSNNNYQWDNNGNNGTIKDVWADLEAGCALHYQSAANVDLSTLWNDIQAAVGAVTQVIAVVGAL